MNPIDPTVHQALDGEIPQGTLAPALRRDAERLEAAVALLAAAPVEGSVEQRVMAAIRRPAASAGRRVLRWVLRPHAVVLRMRPIWSLALAASVLLLAVLPSPQTGPQLGADFYRHVAGVGRRHCREHYLPGISNITAINVTPSTQSVTLSSGTSICLQAIASTNTGQQDISSSATWAFTDPSGQTESGLAKTTAPNCNQGQAFSVGTLSPTPIPVILTVTASAPSSGGGTVTSNKVSVGITQ